MAYTFIQPDFESDSGTEYKQAIDNSIGVMARVAAMFAAHESDTPDMYIHLDAGDLWVNNALVHQNAQTTPIIVAPAGSDHRIDRVVIDALTGARSVITGTPGGSPTAPAITSGLLPICQVYLSHGMTVITNDLITDERVLSASSSSGQIEVGGFYSNAGIDPATELGYGTWLATAAPKTEWPQVEVPGLPSGETYFSVWTPTTYRAYHKRQGAAYNPIAYCMLPESGGPWGAEPTGSSGAGPYTLRLRAAFSRPVLLSRIFYLNYRNPIYGYYDWGWRAFTLYGSNDDAAMTVNDLDTVWTAIDKDPDEFAIRTVPANEFNYILVDPAGLPYRYYQIKVTTNWGGGGWYMQDLELQVGSFTWKRVS
jgi:hypothetical protein